eukprot:2485931-Amphidinium_carterae.1
MRPLLASQAELATCSSKLGQRLERAEPQMDGTFLLRDIDTKLCVVARRDLISLGVCHSDHRWRAHTTGGAAFIEHVRERTCFDAGDDDVPRLYRCHKSKEDLKQQFDLVDSKLGHFEHVRKRGGWADNGRVRTFPRCLDFNPVPPIAVVLEACKKGGVIGRWSKLGSFEPMERRMWNAASQSLRDGHSL